MSEQETQKLIKEAAEIRRRYAAEANAERRAQLTARYYQIEAELKALKAGAPTTRTEAQSKDTVQKVIAGAPTVVSEPFGIRMGVPIGQLGANVVDWGNGVFGLRSAPKPDSFFEHYMVHASSESVVTAVTAFRTVSPVNRYGSELCGQFLLIISKLERIYGSPSQFSDYIDEDSNRSAPGQWLLGLMEGDRTLSAEWDDRATIPTDLKRIYLYAGADRDREGQITLRYESIGYEVQSKGAIQNVAASAPTDASEPFGIRMGKPLGQLGVGASDYGKGQLRLQTVPKPHSFFDFYVAATSPESFVTAVTACKLVTPVNRYGSELRSQFQLMVSRLERIYGEPSKSIDHIKENSKWTAPGQWMLGLMEDDCTLYVEWDDDAGIPTDLKRIWLLAGASSNREGHITLSYESINYEVDLEAYYAEDDESL